MKTSLTRKILTAAGLFAITIVFALIINATFPKEDVYRFTNGVVPSEHTEKNLAQAPKDYIFGYTDLTFKVDGTKPLEEPIYRVDTVASVDDLESYARTHVYQHDNVEKIISFQKGVEVIVSGDKNFTARVVFDSRNGVDVDIQSSSDIETTLLAQRIEENTFVPPNTEVTPYAKAHLIKAVVESVT